MDTAGIPGPIPVTPVIATTEQVCLTCFQNSKVRYLYTMYMSVHVVYLIIFICDINTLLQEHDIGIEDAKKICICKMRTNAETFQKRRYTVG